MTLSILSGWDAPPRTFLVVLLALTFALLMLPQAWFERVRRLALSGIPESPTVTILAIGLWTMLVTAEYWALGHRSLAVFGDEGGLSFPYFVHLSHLPQWGTVRFDPSVLGGSEIPSLFASGGSLFSLEIFEFKILGPELGFILAKVLNTFLATYGAFLVARRGVKAPFGVSLLIGFGYSISFLYVDSSSLAHGLGYGLIPLAVYTLIYRVHRPYYHLGCLGLALLLSISMTISHSNIALYVAIFCIAIYERVAWRPRFLLGLTILTMVILVVWANVLYGMLSFVALTPRGQDSEFYRNLFGPLYLMWSLVFDYLYTSDTLFVIIVVAIVSGLRRRALGTIVLALSPWLLALAYTIVPLRRVGLGALETIDPNYLYFATPAVLVVVLAVPARELCPLAERGKPIKGLIPEKIFVSFMIAVTASSFLATKHLHLLELVGGSSREIYHIKNVEKLAETADSRFRVLAGPNANSSEYFSDNVLLAYGFETIGGFFNLIDMWHNEYWKRAGVGASRGFEGLTQDVTDCAAVYQLRNVDLLRLSGVRYVVSRTRVEAPDLRLISGPADAVSEHCTSRGLHRIALALQRDRPVRDAFIYELSQPLPIAYFAREARHSHDPLDSDPFWDEVRRHSVDRVVLGAEIGNDEQFNDQAEIVSLHRETNGYVVETESRDISLFVLNHPAVPFWRATVDGSPARIVSVDGIQMAVRVPAGRHRLDFSYCRWMPSDYLRKISGLSDTTSAAGQPPGTAQICRAG
jgi:hypothetical protein